MMPAYGSGDVSKKIGKSVRYNVVMNTYVFQYNILTSIHVVSFCIVSQEERSRVGIECTRWCELFESKIDIG